MALDNYTNLQLAIQTWADRNDAAFVAACPDFITLFEANANTETGLATRFNTKMTALTLTGTSNLVALPADFLNAKAMVNTTTSPVQIVPVQTPSALYTTINNPTATGPPQGATITGSNMEFAPNADQSYNINLYYFQVISPLATAAGGVNWLLTNYPGLYLFGSLLAAEAFLGSDPRLQTWGTLYDNQMQKIEGSTSRGVYGGSPLFVRADAVV